MGDREVFMNQALNVILATPNHPLSGLVDPATGDWRSRSPYKDSAENDPPVQAGHMLSNWAGGDRSSATAGSRRWHTAEPERR